MPAILTAHDAAAIAKHEEFVDIVCSDAELMRAEFDAIISEEWPDPPRREPWWTGWATGANPAGPRTSSGPAGPRPPRAVRVGGWVHERSPPLRSVNPNAPEHGTDSGKAGGPPQSQSPLTTAAGPRVHLSRQPPARASTSRAGWRGNHRQARTPEAPPRRRSRLKTRTRMTMTVDRTSLYSVLGLTSQATQEQVRHAYRALLRRNHPDTREPNDSSAGVGSDTALQQVVAAYAVLGDPGRRADYDQSAAGPSAPERQLPRAPGTTYGQPPIQVGPVRWHRWTW